MFFEFCFRLLSLQLLKRSQCQPDISGEHRNLKMVGWNRHSVFFQENNSLGNVVMFDE